MNFRILQLKAQEWQTRIERIVRLTDISLTSCLHKVIVRETKTAPGNHLAASKHDVSGLERNKSAKGLSLMFFLKTNKLRGYAKNSHSD